MELAQNKQPACKVTKPWISTVNATITIRYALIVTLAFILTWITSVWIYLRTALGLTPKGTAQTVVLVSMSKTDNVLPKSVTYQFVWLTQTMRQNALHVQTDLTWKMDVVCKWMDIVLNGWKIQEYVRNVMLVMWLTRTITQNAYHKILNDYWLNLYFFM